MVPQVANVVSEGFAEDAAPLLVQAASTTPSASVVSICGAFVRFRFRLTVVSDVYQFRALYDAHVLLDKS
jgi:hypothetical protein